MDQVLDIFGIGDGVAFGQVEHHEQAAAVGHFHLVGGQKVADAARDGVAGRGIKAIRLEPQEAEALDLLVKILGGHRGMHRHQGRRARIAARLGGHEPIGTLEIACRRKREGKGQPMDLPAGHQLGVTSVEQLPVGDGKLPPDQLVGRPLLLPRADIELPTIHVGMSVEDLRRNQFVQLFGPNAVVQIVIGQRKRRLGHDELLVTR